MPKTNEKTQRGMDQGNAIENETCDVECHDAKAREGEADDGGSGGGAVTEEESKLAEEYPDGGESGGKKY